VFARGVTATSVFTYLREQTIRYYRKPEPHGTGGFWVVTKHEGERASRRSHGNPVTYSSDQDQAVGITAAGRHGAGPDPGDFKGAGLAMDHHEPNNRHRRRWSSPGFSPRLIEADEAARSGDLGHRDPGSRPHRPGQSCDFRYKNAYPLPL